MSSVATHVAASVELLDCSARSRIGLKGPRAVEWLQQQGHRIPVHANTWGTIGDDADSVIARLGHTEFLLEQSQPGILVTTLAENLREPLEGVYPVLREDRSFELRGQGVHDVLAQVCNVDFKSVSRSERQLVMTMMIGIAVLVIPLDSIQGQSPNAAQQEWGTVPNANSRSDASTSNAARVANGGCYRIWCDPSYGDYLWASLRDVMRDA